jgi:hypothetical protein
MPTKEQIEQIIRDLQPILRIADWDISVDILPAKEFKEKTNSDGQAHNHIVRTLNSSHITINSDGTCDWYTSLLHELVHLIFDSIEQAGTNACNLTSGNVSKCIDDNYMVAMERTVDRIANIIAKIYPISNFDHILKPI